MPKLTQNKGVLLAIGILFVANVIAGFMQGMPPERIVSKSIAPACVTTAIGTLIAVIACKIFRRDFTGYAIIVSTFLVFVLEIVALVAIATPPATVPVETATPQATQQPKPLFPDKPIDLSDPDEKK